MPYKLNAVALATSVIFLTACSHKDNANTPATAPASSIASINAADLAVDHAGNPISSAPVQSAMPAVTAQPSTVETLPFIGNKSFNFDGGEQTIKLITIKRDGTVVLKEPSGGEGIDQKFAVSYKGKFTNPLTLSKADGSAALFKDGKVYRLINGQLDTSCSDIQAGTDNIPCVSELDSID